MHGLIFETSVWLLAGSTRFQYWSFNTVTPPTKSALLRVECPKVRPQGAETFSWLFKFAATCAHAYYKIGRSDRTCYIREDATTSNFPLPFPTWIVFLSRLIMRLRTQASDDILKAELHQSWLGPAMSFARAALETTHATTSAADCRLSGEVLSMHFWIDCASFSRWDRVAYSGSWGRRVPSMKDLKRFIKYCYTSCTNTNLQSMLG